MGVSDRPWYFTGFYGDPDKACREASWRLLAHLRSLFLAQWLYVGDFNEIMDHTENLGGAIRSERQMASFRSTLEECRLHDLGFSGPKFTWSNCRGIGQHTGEHLDRAMATQEWYSRFPEAAVSVLAARCSDQIPYWSGFIEFADKLVEGVTSNLKPTGIRMLNVWRLSNKHGRDSVSGMAVPCSRCKGNYKSVRWLCLARVLQSIATQVKFFLKRPSS